MPLKHSKSKAAFKSNVAKEVNAGKPVKQAVAIAYRVREPKKKTKAFAALNNGKGFAAALRG